MIEQLQVLNPSCSHQQFPSLIPLALRFPNIIQQSELQRLDNEWTFAELPFNYETMPVDEFWGKLSAITNGAEEQHCFQVYAHEGVTGPSSCQC